MEKKVLYVSDLDGTLLDEEAKITQFTRETINELIKKGLSFSVATARGLDPTMKMLKGVEISVPIILFNGVLIYDTRNKEFVKVNKIDEDEVKTVIKIVENYNVCAFMNTIEQDGNISTCHFFSKGEDVSEYVKKRTQKYNSTECKESLSEQPLNNIIYFTLIDSYEKLLPISEELKKEEGIKIEFYKNVYQEGTWFLEIFNETASKKNAIAYIKKTYGFDSVIGFGDNYNDIPLFEMCDIKVAVKNAVEDLKNMATYICESNTNDGVARWLKENFNK